jgi:hypothetical protein
MRAGAHAAPPYGTAVAPSSSEVSIQKSGLMKFIEMSGKTLLKLVSAEEMKAVRAAGITEHSLVRINQQGDLEVRQQAAWGIIGGLIGDYESRVKKTTGLDWA